MKKFTISFVLYVSLLSLVSNVYGQSYSGGSGTSGDPYQIATPSDLVALSNASSSSWQTDFFIQTADIIFPVDSSTYDWDGDGTLEWNGDGSGDDELGFKPIGNQTATFWKVFNGQHYTIYNLFINRPDGDFSNPVALFGHVGYPTYGTGDILNVRLKNARITGGTYTACIVAVGGSYETNVQNSSCSGLIAGSTHVGGITAYSNRPITRNTFFGSISASSDYSGGLAGFLDNSGNNDNYAISTVTGNRFVGGLVGSTFDGNFNRNYAVSSVNGGSYTGGLFGNSSMDNISYSYWSEEFAGVSSSDGGNKVAPEALTETSTYSTFDFTGSTPGTDYYWLSNDSIQGGLPYLWFETATDTVDILASDNSSSITNGQTDEVISSFSLRSTGEAKDDVTFFVGSFPLSGSRSGYSNFKLWKSSDNSFSASADVQLGSTIAVDPGESDTLFFGPFLDELDTSTAYYFVTADVAAGASGSPSLAINSKSVWVKHAKVFDPGFYIAENGVTIKCPGVAVGGSFSLNGTTYTRRDKSSITPGNASTTCTTGITDMSSLFDRTSFNGNISHWDVSSVTNMSGMFRGSYSSSNPFNQDISDWDVSNVRNMTQMFQYSSFNQDIGDWDVSNVTSMNAVFQGASNFNQDLSGWNTSKVTNMYAMFHYTSFNHDISGWDVSSVVSMIRMFGYSPFNQDISGWNVSRVVFMSEMFEGNTAFNQDIGGWTLNTGQFSADEMFNGATSFDQDLSNWNLSGVKYANTLNDIAKNSGIDSLNSSVTIAAWWANGYNHVDWHPDYDEDLVLDGTIDTTQLAARNWTLSGNRVAIDRPGETQNTDATLSSLTLSTGSLNPTFASGTTSYTVDVANSVDSIAATATVNYRKSTITVNGVSISSGVESRNVFLQEGNNTFTFLVTAEDNTVTKTYTIVVNRALATPDQATLSSPADGATGQAIAPTLEWGTAARATAYTVQVSTDNFTSTVVNQSTASTSLNVSGLDYSTTYQWRVKATNNAGDAAWSSTRTFTTGAPAIPGAPSLSSPADGADSVDASATLQWASSSNATGYDVQVSTDGFATTVVNSSTSGTSLSASLDWATSYSWRVRATNQSGSSDWSEARDFRTRAVPVPDPPALSFPAEGATGLAADSVLEWGSSAYATGYDLEVSTSVTFATTVVSTSTTGRSLSPSLGWSSTYYWRVRATNGSGESDWSEAKSFSTRAIPLPGSPTVTSGSDGSGESDGSGNSDGSGDDSGSGSGDGDPDDPDPSSRSAIPTRVPVDTTLTWTPGEYATQYRIQVSADTFATFAHNTTVASASFTVNLDYLTMYQWRVRSVNNSGQSSWSDTLAFITQVPPVEQIPATAMTPDNNTMHAPLNPTLQWQAMPHADAYHLEVTADSFATTMMNATTADTAHPIEGLTYEHRYHWRVRATNATGDGPWSEPVGFRTQLPPVQATTMRAPQQNGTDVEIPTTFEWASVDKATTYEFMLFTDDMLTEVLATHTTDTSITIDTLGYDREYLARVRPKNVTSAGPWRSVEFKTVVNGLATSNEGAGEGVGNGSGAGAGADAGAIPTTYGLEQNYPNPFNPSTVIRYAMPQAGEVQLEVYDMMGRKVSTLVRGTKPAGYHEAVFDASHLGSGAYMYRLMAGDVVLARTLYLIK